MSHELTIDRHPQGKNPDCLFFERMGPQLQVAGCEGPETMIDPARQQQIRQVAVRSFLDGYLKSDAKALARLSALHREFAEAEVLVEVR